MRGNMKLKENGAERNEVEEEKDQQQMQIRDREDRRHKEQRFHLEIHTHTHTQSMRVRERERQQRAGVLRGAAYGGHLDGIPVALESPGSGKGMDRLKKKISHVMH